MTHEPTLEGLLLVLFVGIPLLCLYFVALIYVGARVVEWLSRRLG